MHASLAERVRVNEDNREPRQPLILLVDTSGSMSGDLPDVCAGLAALRAAIVRDAVARNRVELALVTFGGAVTTHGDFREAAVFEPPALAAVGDTPMATALERALNLVEAKKGAYKESGLDYYRPLIFLLTDGEPTDTGRWAEAVRRVREAERARKIVSCRSERRPPTLRGSRSSRPIARRSASGRRSGRACSSGSAAACRRGADRVRARRCRSRNPTGPRGWGALPA